MVEYMVILLKLIMSEVNSGRVRGKTAIADHARGEQWSSKW